MSDFGKARQQMVDCQIRPNDVTDYDIIDAFSSMPREVFVPQSKKLIAYIDCDIALESGTQDSAARFLMQVTPFAKMIQATDIRPNELVLCIGCGSGYGAAIIAKLAGSVVAIDEDQGLVDRASDAVSDMAIDNLAVIQGSLEAGCSSEAPFDVIFIEGAVDSVPDALFGQLREGGRLVAVVGRGLSAMVCVYHRKNDDISVTRFGNVSVPSLPGFQQPETFLF